MTTFIAIAVFGLLFAVFALLGPAERSKPCGGKKPGQNPCSSCPLVDPDQPDSSAWAGCPGKKKLP